MKKRVFLLMSLLCTSFIAARLRLRDGQSTIHLSSGSVMTIDNQIQNFYGVFEKESGSQLHGAGIAFDNGVFIEGNKKFDITADWRTDGDYIELFSGATLRGNGLEIEKPVNVRGSDNRLEGEVVLSSDLVLYDTNSTVTLALTRSLNHNIQLNNGRIVLEEDLYFVALKKLIGPGTVSSNGRQIIFGSKEMSVDTPIYFDNVNNLELGGHLHLSQTWTFSGRTNMISGRRVTLFLEDGGNIVVERGSSLFLSNIDIKKVGNDNIRCLDNTATLSVQNCVWYLDSNYNFSVGSIYVTGDFDIFGPAVFTYQSTQTSTIAKNAALIFERNMTFSYAPANARKDLLCFEDSSSYLGLNSATLYASRYGLQLVGGQAVVSGSGTLMSELTEEDYQGITFGDGISAERDFYMTIGRGAALYLGTGLFEYKNVYHDLWCSSCYLSGIVMMPGSIFHLYSTLNLGMARLFKSAQAGLIREPGTDILGSVEFTS